MSLAVKPSSMKWLSNSLLLKFFIVSGCSSETQQRGKLRWNFKLLPAFQKDISTGIPSPWKTSMLLCSSGNFLRAQGRLKQTQWRRCHCCHHCQTHRTPGHPISCLPACCPHHHPTLSCGGPPSEVALECWHRGGSSRGWGNWPPFFFFFSFYFFGYLFCFVFLKLINLFLFSYNCLHFLRFPPRHPNQSHLPPPPSPPPWSHPCVPHSSSYRPLSPLSPPHSPVAIVTMFLISMSLVIFCLLFSFVDYVPDKGEITWYQKIMVHLHNGILRSREKEGAYTLWNSMDGTGEHYAQWNKPSGKRQIPYDLTFNWNITWQFECSMPWYWNSLWA